MSVYRDVLIALFICTIWAFCVVGVLWFLKKTVYLKIEKKIKAEKEMGFYIKKSFEATNQGNNYAYSPNYHAHDSAKKSALFFGLTKIILGEIVKPVTGHHKTFNGLGFGQRLFNKLGGNKRVDERGNIAGECLDLSKFFASGNIMTGRMNVFKVFPVDKFEYFHRNFVDNFHVPIIGGKKSILI
jgi:hypothetical protein